ncbi:MAG: hypothetical protein AAF456_07670 [Planctomycetota bacterium]
MKEHNSVRSPVPPVKASRSGLRFVNFRWEIWCIISTCLFLVLVVYFISWLTFHYQPSDAWWVSPTIAAPIFLLAIGIASSVLAGRRLAEPDVGEIPEVREGHIVALIFTLPAVGFLYLFSWLSGIDSESVWWAGPSEFFALILGLACAAFCVGGFGMALDTAFKNQSKSGSLRSGSNRRSSSTN